MGSDADDKIREIVELAKLYDIYGDMLSDHNRVVFEDYVLNNYSLGEIAGEVDISRQGVRDIVVRCSGKLRRYEEKLGFLKKINETEAALNEMEDMINAGNTDPEIILYCVRKARETLVK